MTAPDQRGNWERFFEVFPTLLAVSVVLQSLAAFGLWAMWNALWPASHLTFERAAHASAGLILMMLVVYAILPMERKP